MLPGPLPREVAGYLFIATQFSPDAKCGFLHLWASSPPEHFCVLFPEGGPAAGVAERGATSRGGASRDLLSVLGLCCSPAVAVSVSWDGVSQVLVGKPIAACGHHYVQLPSACCRGPHKNGKASRGSVGSNVFTAFSVQLSPKGERGHDEKVSVATCFFSVLFLSKETAARKCGGQLRRWRHASLPAGMQAAFQWVMASDSDTRQLASRSPRWMWRDDI